MHNNKPIGIFDSGIGGTSIWNEIHALLPSENTIYLADSKNAPYGQKTKKEILSLSFKNTEYLLELGAKMIVVACNTATTNAIRELRASFDVPFIGIEPAIKPAALESQTNIIGVLATKGTISSDLFSKAVQSYRSTTVVEQMGIGLVKLIENGKMESPEMSALLQQYLAPMIQANIDILVLGCSHYPYLIPQIRRILPPSVKIIDSGRAVARQTRKILEQVGFSNAPQPSVRFLTNADKTVLQHILQNQYAVEETDF